MSRGNRAIQVVVRSRKTSVRVVALASPLSASLAHDARHSHVINRVVVFEDVLDEQQQRLIHDARELACATGAVLKVTDLSRMGVIRRLFERASTAGRAVLRRPDSGHDACSRAAVSPYYCPTE